LREPEYFTSVWILVDLSFLRGLLLLLFFLFSEELEPERERECERLMLSKGEPSLFTSLSDFWGISSFTWNIS